MCSGADMARNLTDASGMIREAAAGGARYVTTPEISNIMEPDRQRLRALARFEAEDASVAGYADLASTLGIWLNVGSLVLKGGGEKLVNRSLLFAPDGSMAARYDKLHLFDVDLPGSAPIRESSSFEPGSAAVLAVLPWCKLGMTICYDIRFAALYRALAQGGAEVLNVPAAFTVPTGKAHWHVLLRARAIENGCYVIAAAQGGRHESGRETFGHSLVVSPWGEIIAEAGTDPGVFTADIDVSEVARVRGRIPALKHDRAFVLNQAGSVAT